MSEWKDFWKYIARGALSATQTRNPNIDPPRSLSDLEKSVGIKLRLVLFVSSSAIYCTFF
jgi:hypothetical protein